MEATMTIFISPSGDARYVYAEAIDLSALGEMQFVRASRVEPDGGGEWWADLCPIGGPVLGPFTWRSVALSAEIAWLGTYWLGSAPG
jgi:hypothetical protein